MDPTRERTFEAEGQTYTLVFGNRAFRLIGETLGKPFGLVLRDLIDIQTDKGLDLRKMDWGEVTVVVWMGLQQHHPNISQDAVDDIIDQAGGLMNLVVPVTEALIAAFQSPEEKGSPQGNGKRAPRRAQSVKVGTGTNTSSSL